MIANLRFVIRTFGFYLHVIDNFIELTKRFSFEDDLEDLQYFLNSVSIFLGSFLVASSNVLANFSTVLIQTSQSPSFKATTMLARATKNIPKNNLCEFLMIFNVYLLFLDYFDTPLVLTNDLR